MGSFGQRGGLRGDACTRGRRTNLLNGVIQQMYNLPVSSTEKVSNKFLPNVLLLTLPQSHLVH